MLMSFMKYFVWQALKKEFKKHLIQIITRTHLFLDEIMKISLLPVIDMKITKKKKTVNLEHNFVSFAVKAVQGQKKNQCILCHQLGANASHPTGLCTKYPSPLNITNLLTEKGGCNKYARLSHTSNNCKFRLLKGCNKCSAWHMNFLCNATASNNESVSSNIKVGKKSILEKSGTTTAQVNDEVAVLPSSTSDSMLPTFTFNTDGNS